MDSIIKNVQGKYIKLFEEKLANIFEVVFEGATAMEEKKSLLKMFKIWTLFFNS